ncbi:Aldo/keto reductase [Laetiporus sulphureus 93-53]|uniref:Aldo/keto reductase n=1 Tax=Laetiporus sulphureus 93-53 TaxID=1314785 RepID=A0A165F2Q9_9APHY|nr:Aldo/keto reductase [Laetiporus sulphureus 93-53]KZT08249.1 Aldo/keto reductase [Laetiporus sulphureus 93-53]
MPSHLVKLNDGTYMPKIAFGTWRRGNGQGAIDIVNEALSAGFTHIDSAQAYGNEAEAGAAIRANGLKREDVYITTKFSSRADLETSLKNSCEYFGVDYVDMYLIHGPKHAQPDIPTIWKKMEEIQADGLAKSIGVSNFNVEQLETLLSSATTKPAVNQIMFYPYNLKQQAPILSFCTKHGIVTQGYGVNIPLIIFSGGPVDEPLYAITQRLNAKPEQVLLAWARAKGVVVVTSSTKRERMDTYIQAGDIELTDEDVAAIDKAGEAGPPELQHS